MKQSCVHNLAYSYEHMETSVRFELLFAGQDTKFYRSSTAETLL